MKPVPPWYRHPEPWLLLMAPLAAVIGGYPTLWLALNSNHSLVVDDYYREGRAINQTFARDAQAERLGLMARWQVDPLRNVARLSLSAESAEFIAPERMNIRLVHATKAALDHHLTLARIDTDQWEAPFAPPIRGRWTIQVEDPARNWRLVAPLSDPGAPLVILAGSAKRTH